MLFAVEKVGELALALALPVALYAAVALALGAARAAPRLIASGRRAVAAQAALVTLAVLGLWAGFVGNDFSLAYVADHSNRALPLFYKLTAPWGGNEGSLLLWVWLLVLYAWLVLRSRNPEGKPDKPWALAILSVVAVFFLTMLNFVTPPFVRLPVALADGSGLNPLLQNPYMAVHPPLLYMGFVGLAIPFAYAMAALLARHSGPGWVKATRRWTLAAFLFLSMGILLGGHWAYHMLGWGGYWAWDPVENASLLPWLAGTAVLHSLAVQERRGMFKAWNAVLVSLAFVLTIFGTFVTRSGLISSVHAFANSGLGPYFMVFIALSVLFALWVILDRAPLLQGEHELESAVSREGGVLLSNVLFLGAVFAVVWGEVYPLISEAISGQKVTVGAPYYISAVLPLGVAVVALMGIGPLLGWRHARLDQLRRSLLGPLGFAVLVLVVAGLLGAHQVGALIAVAACALTFGVIVTDSARALTAAQSQPGSKGPLAAAWRLLTHDRRRWGGYLVHLAVVLMGLGFIGSSAYATKVRLTLHPGATTVVRGYALTYLGLGESAIPGGDEVFADVAVRRGSAPYGALRPGVLTYTADPGEPLARVGLKSNLEEDLYVVLAGATTTQATFDVYVNPLVSWIWIGQIVLAAGTLWAVWPERRSSGAAA